MACYLIFPPPPKALAPNERVHWRTKAAAVASYREYARIMGLKYKGDHPDKTYPVEGPVTALTTFAFRIKRNRDEDNLGASLKALWDGLVDAKVLAADDSQSLHHAPVRVVVDKALKVPEVRIILESIYETGSKRG